jgi:cell wall-associated NlpC family hydrolase
MLGVKWRHQGRSPRAVDCIGLLVLSARAAGRDLRDRKGYGRDATRDGLREALVEHFGQPSGYVHGGVALCKWDECSLPSHVGIVAKRDTGWYLIHGYSLAGKVVEHRIDAKWGGTIIEVFDPWADK